MGSRVRKVSAAAAIVALAGAGVWRLAAGPERVEANEPQTSATVTTALVERRTLEESKTYGCSLGHGPARELPAASEGTVTWLPSPGSTVSPGDLLYRLDDRPAVLMRGETPAWRDLGPGVSAGPDIAQLRAGLEEMGHGKGLGDATTWTRGLTAAVKSYQKAVGVKATGTLALGAVHFLPEPIRVDEQPVSLGARAVAGEPILQWTSPTPQVTCSVPETDRALVPIGATATVRFADGHEVKGTVVALTPGSDDEGARKLTAQLDVPEETASQGDGASARVTFTRPLATDALATPVTALVALQGGGFGVQRQDPSGVLSYVRVTPGVFADSWVEVEGDLAEGDKVVVTP